MRERFESEKWFYGLTLSAMSLSNLLFGPIMGALYDRTHQTRLLILILNIFEIAGMDVSIIHLSVFHYVNVYIFIKSSCVYLSTGNFMYFSSTSKYMVFGSRLLTGKNYLSLLHLSIYILFIYLCVLQVLDGVQAL